jgi:hypothetical protein
MGTDLKSSWPPNLPRAYLIRAAGGAGNTVPCPNCKADVEPAEDGSWGPWVRCGCNYQDDLLGTACRATESEPADLVARLAADGCRPAKRLGADAVAAYTRDQQALQVLGGLFRAAWSRHLDDNQSPGALALGLTDTPHSHPHWWALAPAEAAAAWTSARPRRTREGLLQLAFWHKEGQAGGYPLFAVPEYDRPDRVVGLCLFGDRQVANTCHTARTGWGFFHARTGRAAAWGDTAFLAAQTLDALLVHGQQARVSSSTLPLLSWSKPEPPPAGLLPDRPYVLWSGRAGALGGAAYRLAARLGARVLNGGLPPAADPAASHAVKLWAATEHAESWHRQLSHHVMRLAPFGLSGLINQFGRDAEGLGLLADRLDPHARDRVLAETRGRPQPAVTIRAGLTVEAYPDRWVWAERGVVLTDAVPVVRRVYVGRKNRVRHAGFVRFHGAEYRFDTATFRRHPAAAVEAALVRGGAAAPPLIHPAAARHLADLTLYFHKPEESA